MPSAETDELDATLDASTPSDLLPDDPLARAWPSVGDTLGDRYILEAELGRGGMGTVFRAHDAALGETVALKLLSRANPRTLTRFRREVRLARRITHPNIARTHDLGESEGAHFLTMEYVPGPSLDSVLAEEPRLPLERALTVTRAVLRGLAAAHAVGVVHRDLKPANVLMASDSRILVTDFGIAQTTGEIESHAEIVGTPAYMAPEQVARGACDARADLFALGVLLFEMLTGELPYEGDTAMELAMARLHEPPRPIDALLEVPPEIACLLGDLLARDPDQRPPSAAAVSLRLAPRSTPAASSSGPFAPVVKAQARAVAVLPFAYRGPEELGDLGESLAEETIDILSRTRGLRVLAYGAAARFSQTRDPLVIARELGADNIVDGSVRLSGSRVRLKARLVGHDGLQLWTEQFDAPVQDVFDLSESMARRVAESLRVQLAARAQAGTAGVPREALELYFQARKHLRNDAIRSASVAVDLLDECLALAPNFSLARAAHAMASVRAWWIGITLGRGGDEEAAAQSVAAAARHAPELAETHFAQAMFHMQGGRVRECAWALQRALEIAPTFAEAQQYLGGIQLETDRVEEGLARVRLARELNPRNDATATLLARELGLSGDYEAAYRIADEVTSRIGNTDVGVIMIRLRAGLWSRDLDVIRRQNELFASLGGPASLFARSIAFAYGEVSREEAEQLRRQIGRVTTNRRFIALAEQIAAEVYAVASDYELTLTALQAAADSSLIDSAWLRRCPLFDPLRDDPRFRALSAVVRERARSVFTR